MKRIMRMCMSASIVLVIMTLYGCRGDCPGIILRLKGDAKDFMYFKIEQGTISLFSNKRHVSGVMAGKEHWYSRIHISPSTSSNDFYDIYGLHERGASEKNVKTVSIHKSDVWKLRSRNVTKNAKDYGPHRSNIIEYKLSDDFKGVFFIMLIDLAVAYDYQRYDPKKHWDAITYSTHGERARYYRELAYGEELAQAVARTGITGKTPMTEGLDDEQSVKAVIREAESFEDLRLLKISGDGKGGISISHGGKTKRVNPNEEYAFRLTEAQTKSLPFLYLDTEFIEGDLCGRPVMRRSLGAL